MPLIQDTADALPYIDPQPSDHAIDSAKGLIHAELDPESVTTLHPSIPVQREPRFSDLVEAEHARIASGQPKEGGIDLSRYEALDAPATGDLEAWRSTLQKAYASSQYLEGRNTNLSLLEVYGKNAWLVSNSALQDELKALERDVEAAKVNLEEVEQARRAAQQNVAGEMQGLDEAWRTGVGRMIEAQAAGERLRMEILKRRRRGAA